MKVWKREISRPKRGCPPSKNTFHPPMMTTTATASQNSTIIPPKRPPRTLLPSFCSHTANVDVIVRLHIQKIAQSGLVEAPVAKQKKTDCNCHRYACHP